VVLGVLGKELVKRAARRRLWLADVAATVGYNGGFAPVSRKTTVRHWISITQSQATKAQLI
jgi:hypothetical protein